MHVSFHLAFMTIEIDFLILFYLKISFFMNSFQWKSEFITQGYRDMERKLIRVLWDGERLKNVGSHENPDPVIVFVITMLWHRKYLEFAFRAEILQDWSQPHHHWAGLQPGQRVRNQGGVSSPSQPNPMPIPSRNLPQTFSESLEQSVAFCSQILLISSHPFPESQK